ncbi:uncharacterized protein LOC111700198 [Eurytemora carolleeae]|uniref:uncharacterized protein LOC111700198 n=1 Tax=Eurytemora carolleeae TaxID=1294199 RepID=UPI000C775913|nr:uncharacterized protein LOC111700198 [Eurytemora carolleeae]|eukprot:XP_023326817.1 uncharacterized protein LOC111700198 [Eurytemora affinis]
MMYYLFILLLFSSFLSLSSQLNINTIHVPKFTQVGESTSLKCDYDLEDDKLYSIKWYKDNQEFYRYVPKDIPPSQRFQVPGSDVRLELSDMEIVHLHNISLISAGLYTCEVSTEAPRFRTTAVTQNMRVIHPPESGPYLLGGRTSGYRVGEMLDVNCSSPASHPPVLLKFYLNDEPVNEKNVYKFERPAAKDGLTPALSSYTLRIKRIHFRHGYLHLKCTADIFKTYYKSAERTFQGIDLGEKALGRQGVNGATTIKEKVVNCVRVLILFGIYLIY